MRLASAVRCRVWQLAHDDKEPMEDPESEAY
jgi:hypothetical protein